MTTTATSRDATSLKDLLWAQVEPQVYITREQYFERLEDCDLQWHEENGQVVWATVTKGPEFHFATFGVPWKLTRAVIRRWLCPIIERHGYVTTRVPKDDPRQQRINRRVGFQVVSEDEFYLNMKLEKLRCA